MRMPSALVPLVLMVAPLLLFSAAVFWADYHDEERRSEELARAAAQAADERINWSMRSVDLLLQHVADYAAQARGQEVDTVRTVLAIQGSAMPELGMLLLTDAEGHRLVADHDDQRFVDVSNRQFFTVQRNLHASRQIVIDGPVVEDGAPTVVISRPIIGTDGGFLGVAAAVVEPEFFTSSLRLVAPDRIKATTLFNTNGVVLSHLAIDDGRGRPPLPGAVPPAAFGPGPGEGRAGTWHSATESGGGDSVGAWRVLERYPLAVSAAIPRDVVVETWQRNTLRKALPEMGLVVVLVWLGMVLRRRERALFAAATQFTAELEERVEDRTRSLAREVAERRRVEEALHQAKDAAEAASHAKSRFLAVASHDLRQPVQALNLYANVLAGCGLAGEVAEIVERLRKSASSVAALLESLLDISKLDAGIVRAAPRPVPLRPLLEHLWDSFCPTAEEAGVSLSVVPADVWVSTDPALLERILQNLVTNAIRYTPAGGKVLVGCRRRGDGVELQVCDTGIGIPEDQRQHVFEEFLQLAPSAAGKHQGLGLGLSIVRRLADLLGHRLTLTSETGRGTLFSLRLGICAPAATVPVERHGGGGLLPGASVLVIEDEEEVRHSLALQLRQWGLLAVTAATREEAMARCGEAPIAAVLSDFRLPGGTSGIDLANAVLASLGRRVPVVLLTGDTEPERLREAVRSGFLLLHKPVDPEDLRRAVLAGSGQ
ncbi:MAG: ATP-binding protein [Bacteroidales bacterium]